MTRDYGWLLDYCLQRFGSLEALEARLPVPLAPEALREVGDDRCLSLLARRVFRAGLKHQLVDAKWPAFEEVFWGFVPEKVALMSPEQIERLMQDPRLIRHLAKLRSVPLNARMVLDIAAEHGSFAGWLADWPLTDITGLWRALARQGNQLGGLSAPRFLRMLGKDTFIPTEDVVTALKVQDVIRKAPTSQRDLQAVQALFNAWQAESGRPLCQLSVMLGHTVNH